jgi:D-alanyl-D-alanine endopeptidase (penicillin-binding protein 7)
MAAMYSSESPVLKRLLQLVAALACSITLVAVPAQAAQRKKVEIQKTSAVKVVAKRSSAKSVRAARVESSSKGVVRGIKASKLAQTRVSAKNRTLLRPVAAIIPARPSFGELAGLHGAPDALALKSSVALVIDQDTREVLFSKNDQAVLPIASITKLMTGVVISDARLPMDEQITITQDDVDTEKRSRSRLTVGSTLSRGELLHLALMSSENRAAHALGRTYPGGIQTFVALMNAKSKSLGMKDTRYVEPTGLSSDNQSSARDLATLVSTAYNDPVLRELTTSPGYQVEIGSRMMQFNNTNRLVKNPDWDIGLQKTGFISEAGQCLVLQAKVAGRKLIMVFLDSAGKLSRIGDAERVRQWVEANHMMTTRAHIKIAG